MQKKFDELNQVLRTFANQKGEYHTKVKQIEDSNQFTPQYKRQFLLTIDNEYSPTVDETEKNIEQLIQEIHEGITENSNNADFLSDTEFTNALKLIELSHGNLPIDVVDKINTKFSGNVNALKTLKSVYQAQHCYEGDIDHLMVCKDQQAQQIQDSAYFTLSYKKPLQPLAAAISAYASENGYKFDTDFLTADEM